MLVDQDIAEKQMRSNVVEEHKAHSYKFSTCDVCKFSCPHCHKRFPVKGHIKRHIRLDTVGTGVSDLYSFYTDPDPAFQAEYRSGSGSNPYTGFI